MLAAVLWYCCFNQCILLVDVNFNHWRIAGNSWQLINSSVVVWCEKQLAWNVDGLRTLRPKRKTVTSISTDSESRPCSVPLKKSPCLPHKQHILSETAGTYEPAFEKKSLDTVLKRWPLSSLIYLHDTESFLADFQVTCVAGHGKLRRNGARNGGFFAAGTELIMGCMELQARPCSGYAGTIQSFRFPIVQCKVQFNVRRVQ